MYNLLKKEKIKEEQRKIIGIESEIDMRNFVKLLLSDLASKTRIIYFNNLNRKTACLNHDYKKIIEDIMYNENLGIEFARIIDIYSYYFFQESWEKELSETINSVLKELDKDYTYDFENDTIKIEFNVSEIEKIKSDYDEEILRIMDHFSTLLNNGNYSCSSKLYRKEMNRK